jgi:hypothetical protein
MVAYAYKIKLSSKDPQKGHVIIGRHSMPFRGLNSHFPMAKEALSRFNTSGELSGTITVTAGAEQA